MDNLSRDSAEKHYEKLLKLHNSDFLTLAQKVNTFLHDLEHEILKEITGEKEYFDQLNWLKNNQITVIRGQKTGCIPPVLVSDIENLKKWRNEAQHENNMPILKYKSHLYTMAQTIRFFSNIEWSVEMSNILNDIEIVENRYEIKVEKIKINEGEAPQMIGNKKELFKQLCSDVNKCDKCKRLKDNIKNLSKNNGDLDSKVIFIAKAPGKGAKETGYPLKGDPIGNNFEKLLEHIQLKREDVFITNTIICNAHVNGNKYIDINKEEIETCNKYLKKTIDIVKPRVVVTLGEDALEAIKSIKKHTYSLKKNAAIALKWYDRTLVPLYLMTDENLKAKKVKYKTTEGKEEKREVRNMEQQEKDFEKLKKIVDNLS